MKKKVCSIISVILVVLILACIFLPWVKLDLTAITGTLSSLFTDSSKWESGMKYSLIKIVQELLGYRKDIGSRFWIFMVLLAVQTLLPVVVLGISCIKGKIKFVVNLVLSALDMIILLVVHMLVVPAGIEKVIKQTIDDSIAGDVLSLFHVDAWTDALAEQAGTAYRNSLSVGFYAMLILLAAILVTSVVGIILTRGKQTQEKEGKDEIRSIVKKSTAENGPSLTGISGIYKGAVISMKKGETLAIGRDASQCSLIIQAEQVSRKHCEVSFDEITGQYRVVDYSANGTYINSTKRLMKNQPKFVRRGEVISVGDEQNSFRLN